jgi:hypothetical protein
MLRHAGTGLAVSGASPAAVAAADATLGVDLSVLLRSVAASGQVASELLAAGSPAQRAPRRVQQVPR